MLERYRHVISRVRPGLQIEMLRYFVERGLVPGDAPGHSFYDVLRRARLMQADVVLCALRINSTSSLALAERLVGKRIHVCPPMLIRWTSPVKASRREGDDRVVTHVRRPRPTEQGRTRLLSASMYDRMARAQKGMTVSTLLARGLRRRDIRIAVKRGYLKIA